MNRTDLKRVLRLLHYGATEVNFKVNNFQAHQSLKKYFFKLSNTHDISVEECGWKLKYVRCEKDLETGEIRGDGFHHFYLEKIGKSFF